MASPEILAEYRRVANELSSQFPRIDLSPWLDLIKQNSEVISPIRLREPICSDPDDDKFIACALAGKAFCIVTGDKGLLTASGKQGVLILKPKEFVDKHLGPV